MISMSSSADTRMLDSKEVGLVYRDDYGYMYTKEHISSHRLSKGSKYPTGQDDSESQTIRAPEHPDYTPAVSLGQDLLHPRRRRVIKILGSAQGSIRQEQTPLIINETNRIMLV